MEIVVTDADVFKLGIWRKNLLPFCVWESGYLRKRCSLKTPFRSWDVHLVLCGRCRYQGYCINKISRRATMPCTGNCCCLMRAVIYNCADFNDIYCMYRKPFSTARYCTVQ